MQIMFQACSKTRFGGQSETWHRQGFPSREEQEAFQKWTKQNSRNRYGDPDDTMYAGGDPLFFTNMKLYEYVTQQHPTKPWLKK